MALTLMTISSFVEVKTLEPTTHTKKTKLPKVNSFQYSSFVKIVKDWTSLPNHLFTDEINVNKFKKGLKRLMKIYWHSSSDFNYIYFNFKYRSYHTILYLH